VIRHLRRRALFAAVLAVTVVARAGAVGAASPEAHRGSGQGGSITVLEPIGFSGNWTGFDPAVTTSQSEFEASVLGSLFDIGPHYALVPDLATGYKLSQGGLTLTIHLRHGVAFSNGDPFNSSVVAFNIKRDINPALPNGAQNALNWPMSSVTTPDSYTVVVQFSRLFAGVVSELNQSAFALTVDPAALQKMGEAAYNLTPVGAGPFKVKSDVPSSRLVLTRNPGYWKKGYPKLDSIHVETVGTDESAYEAMLSGQAQIYESMGTVSLVKTVQKAKQVRIYKVPPNSPFLFKFNTTKPPFNNIAAREAMYYATNPRTIDQHLFDNLYALTQSPTGPAGLFYEPKVPGYRTHNLAKAKALVRQVGGLHFDLDVFNLPFVVEAADALQSEWQKAGITVTLTPVNLTQFIETFRSGQWSSFLTIAGSYDPAYGPLTVDSSFGSHSPFSGVHDPALDAMLNQAASTLNTSQRAADYRNIFKYLSEKAYGVFLFNFSVFNMYAKNVVGAVGPPGVGGVGSVITWANVHLR
jgi:peptide/nickel transport system substrate-binding protein